MKFLFLCLFLIGCSATKNSKTAQSLVITEVNPSLNTRAVHDEILLLATTYDLESFLYTRRIVINATAKPRHRPFIVMNTKYQGRPSLLLGQLLHEELHIWMKMNQHKVQVAIPDLKRAFRRAPHIRGSKVKDSTYRHLVICWMEYMAVKKYFGEKEAKKNLEYFISVERRFPWIYGQVLLNSEVIWDIVGKHKLIPDELFQRISIIR